VSSGGEGGALGPIVDAICQINGELLSGRRRKLGRHVLPSREALTTIMEELGSAFFPAHFGALDLSDEGLHYFVGHTLGAALVALEAQIRRGLAFACTHSEGACGICDRRAHAVIQELAAQIPAIRVLLAGDVQAAFDGDPAASSIDEALFSYPGVTAIIYHRVAHALVKLEVPLIPRMIAELAHRVTGIDIHPGAQIGGSFFIDHGTGVVIGETAVIGERVRLYQGVTLGAKRFELDEQGHPKKGVPRHPIVEDDVVIYAGATILGRITIGRGSSIGGNVWLTKSVPPESRITQALVRQEDFQSGGGI
jgi:serine O-acetyltransferase